MAQSSPVQTLSTRSAGAVETRRFVTATGSQAGAKANTLGVSRYSTAADEEVPVDTLGTTEVEAGGAIAAGGAIETDADGKAVAHTDGPVVARALEAAAADGDIIEVVLIPN
ncbi:MAG: capsid cement protein [Bacteroidota bacterium]